MAVSDLPIDRRLVTVAQFTRFVDETGYLTLAARRAHPTSCHQGRFTSLCAEAAAIRAAAAARAGTAMAASRSILAASPPPS